MDQREWLKTFIGKRGLTVPDRRPLYAYKCSEHEYSVAKSLTEKMLLGVLDGQDFRRFHEIFCLFAAETWRREYSGGPFAYRTILDALNVVVPEHAHVRDWITLGLNWWRREIIHGEGGSRRLLLTIACEGGIPVQLLHVADTRLSNYFRVLLTAFHEGGGIPAEILARREVMLLPLSLRQDVVFEVSARLVEAIAVLQPLIREGDEPIDALDIAEPKWRNTLPLPLNDSTVELLLGNLLRHAQKLEKKTASQVRWQRTLTRQGEAWALSAALSLPDRIPIEQLADWTGWDDSPTRLRLLITVADQTRTVAVLSLIERRVEPPFYRCESVIRQGLRLTGRAAAAPGRLTISDGVRAAMIEIAGEQGLSDLPWMFVQGHVEGEARLLAEGSARSRQTEAVLAVAAADQVTATPGEGDVLQIGGLDAFGRVIYRVRGSIKVITADGDHCGIRCAADQDTAEIYLLSGKQLPIAMGDRLPYIGVPGIYAVDRDNRSRPLPLSCLSWSPAGTASLTWTSDPAYCVGRVWIRAIAEDRGGTLLRRCIDVVPSGTTISMRVGSGSQPGTIELSGLKGASFEVARCPGLTVAQAETGVRLELEPDAPTGLTSIHLKLSWCGQKPVDVLLPAPRRGGGFVRAGRTLDEKELVALERLGGIQAVAHGPEGAGRYHVEATISSSDSIDSDLQRLLWLHLPLSEKGQGEFLAPLHLIQEPLASLLAMVPDVNARARLVLSDSVQALAHIDVARYDLELLPQRESSRVLLPPAAQARLADNWQETVTLEMLRLWDLEPLPIPLNLDPDSEAIAWRIPEGLEAGPWWVVGRDGGWARFRPLLWTVFPKDLAEQAEPEDLGDEQVEELTLAIRNPDAGERAILLDSLMHRLSDNPDSEDWERLFAYIRLTREHPANALEIIKCLVQCPQTLALTLLKAGEDDFDSVWSLAAVMPFAWFLVPRSCWAAAAKAHLGSLRKALADIEQRESILWDTFEGFRHRSSSRLRCFGILCDWLQEVLFDDRPLLDQTLRIARLHPEQIAYLLKLREPELQSRHGADEQWPQGPRVMEQVWRLPAEQRFETRYAPYRSVLCAPFVAAHSFLTDHEYSESVVFELRRLRAFDIDWFDEVLTIQMSRGLTGAEPHRGQEFTGYD